jgi:hypothetical protein
MRQYKAQVFAVTGTGFFNFYSFRSGLTKFTVKNGTSPVELRFGSTTADAIVLAANEVFAIEAPFDSLHLKVVTSTNTSNVLVTEFPKF